MSATACVLAVGCLVAASAFFSSSEIVLDYLRFREILYACYPVYWL